MIPVKLYLRNFMSYGDEGTEVDFDFHIACLSGNNGDGKSALLDAITFALWGMARGVSGTGAGSEDLIHAGGAQEAQVEFTFRLGERKYRVTRRRHRKRGGGVGLEGWDEERGAFRPLTSATQRDTQAMINRLLRMEYETFINSAFLLQGRADEFTRRRPTERKQVLSDILDLGQYDELAQRARDEAREAKARASQLAAEIERMREEVGREAEYQADLERWEQAAGQAAEQLSAAEAQAEQAHRQVAALEAQQARLRDLQGRLRTTDREREALGQQIEAFEARAARSRAIVARREEIMSGAAALADLREQENALTSKAQQAATLSRRREAAAAQIEGERKRLGEAIAQKRLAGEAKAAQARRAKRLEKELEEARAALAAAERARQEMEPLREQAQALEAQRAAGQSSAQQARRAVEQTSGKAQLLQGAEARCPVCRQSLKPADREQVLAHLAQERAQAEETSREGAAGAAAAGKALGEIRTRMEALGRQAKSVGARAQQVGTTQEQLEQARQAGVEADQLAAELEALTRQAQGQEYAAEARVEMAQAEHGLARIGYDAAQHQAVRSRIEQIARFERERGLLEQAEASLVGDEQAVADLAASAREKEAAASALTEEIEKARLSVGQLAQARRQADEAGQAVAERRKGHSAAAAEAAVCKERLARCRALADEMASRREQRRQAEREVEAYQALAQAFGKDGIQALIIENVVPQLAQYADELLERLSEGRMRVSFETQKLTSKGEAAETLEIVIREGDSARKYELYSGGEAFRADFAIRVALSRLLAQRAGARLQTLVVDEGFGTQDTQGRQRLVEAILAIADQFERIIVVTHIEDLKDSFPHRIEVTKDEGGSRVRQVAVG